MIFTFENMLYMEQWNLKIIWGQFSLFWIMNYLFQNNNNKFIKKNKIKTQHMATNSQKVFNLLTFNAQVNTAQYAWECCRHTHKQNHLIHQSSKESTPATAKEGPVRLGYRHES